MKKIFPLLFFLGIFLLFLHPVSGDGDFFHHVNTGRFVLEQKKFPTVDEWTFTAFGRPWVAYAWGAGTLFYLIYKTFGSPGIAIFVGMLALCTWGLVYALLLTYRLSRKTIFLTIALAAPIVATRFPDRPEIFTYPFVIAFLLIDRLRHKRPALLFLYPILTLLWANLYGASVFIGLGLLTLICIQHVGKERAGRRAFSSIVTPFLSEKSKLHGEWLDERSKMRADLSSLLFCFVVILSFLLSLLNPYGLRTIFYIFSIPAIAQIQGEWHGIIKNLADGPLDYLIVIQYKILLFFFYLVFFIFLLLFRPNVAKRSSWEVLLALALFLPFVTLRHMPLAIFLSLPSMALLLERQRSHTKLLLIAAGIIIAVEIPIALWIAPPGFTQHPDDFPKEIITFLKEHKLSGTALTNQQLGSFITYHMYPDIRVYADTRDDLFLGTSVLSDFYNTFMARGSVLALLEKYQADLVIGDLADGPSYQPIFHSEQWAIVSMSGHYFIAIRRTFAENKNLSYFSAIDPFSETGAKANAQEKALQEFARAFADDPSHITNQLRFATLLFTLRRFDETIAIAQNITIPRSPKGPIFASIRDYLLVQAYFAKGDCGNTKRFLQQTEKATHRKFIFAPSRTIPSPVNKGYAFFYLICQKNPKRAQEYLNVYLSEPDIEREEEKKTKELFEQTAKRIPGL